MNLRTNTLNKTQWSYSKQKISFCFMIKKKNVSFFVIYKKWKFFLLKDPVSWEDVYFFSWAPHKAFSVRLSNGVSTKYSCIWELLNHRTLLPSLQWPQHGMTGDTCRSDRKGCLCVAHVWGGNNNKRMSCSLVIHIDINVFSYFLPQFSLRFSLQSTRNKAIESESTVSHWDVQKHRQWNLLQWLIITLQ